MVNSLQIKTIRQRRRSFRAFTLVESILSTLVVGLMLVGALEAVRTVHTVQDATIQHAKGQRLAEDLLAEIVKQDFEDSTDSGSGMGQDSGEYGDDRRNFDDVDDYHNWSPSTPLDVDGTPISGTDGWTRHVVVEYVDPDDLTHVVSNNTGVKRVTVTVSYQGQVVTTLQTIRTSAVTSVNQYQIAQGINNANAAINQSGSQEFELAEGVSDIVQPTQLELGP